MKILVTGSSGYIGQALVPYLKTTGHDVTGYTGTVCYPEQFQYCVQGMDCVVYLAGIVGERQCSAEPDISQFINCGCFPKIVDACVKKNVKRFVYLSSNAVYGSTTQPATEDYPVEPVGLYATHKSLCEKLLRLRSNEIEAVIIRSASVMGPSPAFLRKNNRDEVSWQRRFNSVVNIMTKDAVEKGEIIIKNGNQMRALVHIDNLCQAIKRLVEAPKEVACNGPYNVCMINGSVRWIAHVVTSKVSTEMGKQVTSIFEAKDNNGGVLPTSSFKLCSNKFDKAFPKEPLLKFGLFEAVGGICNLWKGSGQ